jgi:hypothetical protein
LTPRLKMLVQGHSKSGKTGLLASAANAGYKIRVLDYDGNGRATLMRYIKPEFHANVDVVTLEDRTHSELASLTEPDGIPDAYHRGLKLLDRWKYKQRDGTEVDLGSPREWGPDTIVVLDSATGQAKAALLRVRALNKTRDLRKLSGAAQIEQEAFTDKACDDKREWHFVATAHLKLIGPKEFDGPSEAKQSKMTEEEQEVLEARRNVAVQTAEIVPVRYFPSAAGQELARRYATHFDAAVLIEPRWGRDGKARRVLTWAPRPEMDLGMPEWPGLVDPLDQTTALAQILRAMGLPDPAGAGHSEEAKAIAEMLGATILPKTR